MLRKSLLNKELFGKKQDVTQNKTFGSSVLKLIYFTFAFDVHERHKLFMQFYKDFDKDENMTFEKDEMEACFEYFASEEGLGKENMKEVFNSLNEKVDTFNSGIKSIFQEGSYSNFTFSPELYASIFEKLKE